MNNKHHSDIVRAYLDSIGKEKAHEMTGNQIHDAIYDLCGESVSTSTIMAIRQKFTGIAKRPGNTGQFNRPFKRVKTNAS